MRLELDRNDLKPEYQNRNISQIQFEHLTDKAQCAVRVVGRGTLYEWDRRSYNTIYPAPTNKTDLVVRDDLGERWRFTGERIRCIGDRTPDGGYHCDSLEEGIRLLNQYGYITNTPKEKV